MNSILLGVLHQAAAALEAVVELRHPPKNLNLGGSVSSR